MYFLTACLIVGALSAHVSSRRFWNLLQDFRVASATQRLAARRRALLPVLCLGFFLLLLLLLSRVLGSEFTAVTADCLVLLVSIFAGLFIGVFGVIAATDRR
ncbi:hypothetical protein ABIB90_002324 [Bradyrhizobium sp. JR4.1]|uniref:hypothetical protein n=1 Tax=unclassified Bradyrhizobium TaxID=2631580 RepID=UPI00339A1BE2